MQQTIGEVTTLWIDDGESDKRAPSATLEFRVGAADEPMPSRGITLLALRLASVAAEAAGFELEGLVDDVRLHLHFESEGDALVDQIAVVARALHGTPVEVVERERKALRDDVEDNGTGPGQYAWMLARLCGPNGPGRLAYKPLGLRRITAQDVLDWTARHCTRGNAVVALDRPPPADLAAAFGALPPGPRIPPPAAEPLRDLRLPAQADDPDARVVAIGALVDAGEAAEALGFVIEHRAEEHLPHLGVEARVTPVDGRRVLVRASARAGAEDAGSVRDDLLSLVRSIAGEGASEGERELWRELRTDELDDEDRARLDLRRAALATLIGGEVTKAADRETLAGRLRGDEVAAAAVLPVSADHSGMAEVSRELRAALPPDVADLVAFPLGLGSVTAIAERLESWLATPPGERAEVGERLRETVARIWSWERVAEDLLAASHGDIDGLARVPSA